MPSSLAVAAPLLSVAAAAGRLGVSTRTLRYYEELGLLRRRVRPAAIGCTIRATSRRSSGSFVCRRSACSLTTIRRILHYRLYRDESGRPVLALEDLRQVVIAARADVEAVHARIETLRRELDEATNEAQGLERDVAFLEQRLAERTAAEP